MADLCFILFFGPVFQNPCKLIIIEHALVIDGCLAKNVIHLFFFKYNSLKFSKLLIYIKIYLGFGEPLPQGGQKLTQIIFMNRSLKKYRSLTCSRHQSLQKIEFELTKSFLMIFFNDSATNNLRQVLY